LKLSRSQSSSAPILPFPKKRLGQNFLIDLNIKRKIIASCHLKPDETVLEIGPGTGVLTFELAAKVKKLIAIEKDKDLSQILSEKFHDSNVKIIHHDILKYSFQSLPNNLKIIGNLPYHIVSPIIKKVLTYRHKFQSFYFMTQLEQGRRLVAQPNSKEYGSLSCAVQYFAEVEKLFQIKPTAFYPKPKVQSVFLHLQIKRQPELKAINENLLFQIIKNAFNQRRKTILNSLSTIISKEFLIDLLKECKIDPKARAENLKLKDYVLISNMLDEQKMRGRH